MLAERRSLPKRDPSQRASVGADIVSSPAHSSAHGSGYHATVAHHRAVSQLSRLGGGGGGACHPRANSDPNLAVRPSDFNSRRSSLTVSKDEYTLGQSESLVVFWDIREPVSASDWIGLYKEGETSPYNYLEYKTQGENRSHVGQISWHVSCDLPFTEDVTDVCFKYYGGGSTGVLRTASAPFRVVRVEASNCNSNGGSIAAEGQRTLRSYSYNSPAECIVFRLSNLRAFGLKKGIFFNPDPYIKMSVCPGKDTAGVLLLPHHSQEARTAVADNTVNPNWSGQFTFVAYANDVIELELKDKFSKSRPIISRFLGRLSLPLWKLLDKATSRSSIECNFGLASKHPSDHVTGQLAFILAIEKRPGEPWPSCLPASSINLGSTGDNSIPGTPVLVRGSSARTSLPNGNVVSTSGAEGILETAAAATMDSFLSNGHTTSTSNSSNNINNNNDSSAVVMRHRQLQQSDFEPASKPKLVDRNTTTHSTWHGRTAARSKAEASRMIIDSSGVNSVMTTSMYSGETSQTQPLPPLPPKLKRPVSIHHRPSHRNKTLQQSTEPSEPSTSQSHCVRPEDSFNFKIVDTDELERAVDTSNELQQSIILNDNPSAESQLLLVDANANVSLVLDESAGVASSLEAVVRQSIVAPLATPERDTLHDGVLSVADVGTGCDKGDLPSDQCVDRQNEDENVSDTAVDATQEAMAAVRCSEAPEIKDECAVTTDTTSDVVRVLDVNESRTTGIYPEIEFDANVDDAPLPPIERNATSFFSDSSDDVIDDVPNADAAESREENAEYQSANSDSTVDSSSDTSPADSSCSGLPQCPPTPTHHANSVRAVTAANTQPQARPSTPTIQAAGPSSTTSTTDAPPPPPPPLPARHLQPPSQHRPTTRLPSIPERTVKFQRVELSPGEEPLPAYWEARIDSHGRIFYIDHMNRTTTWQRPSASQLRRSPNNEQQRLQLDRRYQSIRRTISSRSSQAEVDERPPPPPPPPPPMQPSVTGAEGGQQQQQQPPQLDFLREVLLRAPAVRFVTRPEFFSILHMNAEAVSLYNRNSSLKHMIIKIRRDAHTFERYQHNRDLVTLLNKFADPERDLPRGWETKYDRAGKQFFIDHTSRSTTFIDPRLPLDAPYVNANRQTSFGARRRSRSAGEEEVRPDGSSRVGSHSGPVPPPRPMLSATAVVAHVVPHVPTAYSDKVVAFLRQPNIVDILRERHPAVGSNQVLKDKINCVRVDGTLALDRLSDDIDLIILLSLFEQEIMSYVPAQYCHRSPRDSPQQSPQASPGLLRANARAPAPYKRDFEAKLRNFYRKLESKGYGQGPGKLKINIRRDHLLEDAFNKIMIASKKDLQKSKLYVTFAGEEGLDYGGPSREFFFLLSRELFNPYYGLFEYSANDTYTVQVSPMSAFVDNLHEWFRFSGRVLGLALVHQYLLDAFFTRPFYKALLRILCSLSDLESLDAEFHQSLLWIKDNDVTDILDLYFSVNEEVFGQVVERELRLGGKTILVTEKNKKEYIEKVVKWRLERGVAEQTESLVKGFYEVVDPRLVSVFDARELELVIAGIAEVDVNDWRKNTEYRSGYHDNHPVIHWFWLAIEKIDNERRLRLLQFVTGTSSIPYEGFGSLRGSNGPRKFCIEKWGKPSSLPRAHTCFNRLDLPPYPSFEMLYEKLLLAVEETSTFGIE